MVRVVLLESTCALKLNLISRTGCQWGVTGEARNGSDGSVSDGCDVLRRSTGSLGAGWGLACDTGAWVRAHRVHGGSGVVL